MYKQRNSIYRIVGWGLIVLIHEIGIARDFESVHIDVRIQPEIDCQNKSHHAKDIETKTQRSTQLSPCANSLITVTLDQTSAQRLELTDWWQQISVKVKPKRHELQIIQENYSPATFLIRAGDFVVDPEYGKWKNESEELNGIHFNGIAYNIPQEYGQQSYEFPRAQYHPVEIRHGTFHHRLAYLFITGHTCAALTDVEGSVILPELPCDVDLPMRIQFPWYPTEKTIFESTTLKLNGKGWFKLRVTRGMKNRHVIKILPKPIELE